MCLICGLWVRLAVDLGRRSGAGRGGRGERLLEAGRWRWRRQCRRVGAFQTRARGGLCRRAGLAELALRLGALVLVPAIDTVIGEAAYLQRLGRLKEHR